MDSQEHGISGSKSSSGPDLDNDNGSHAVHDVVPVDGSPSGSHLDHDNVPGNDNHPDSRSEHGNEPPSDIHNVSRDGGRSWSGPEYADGRLLSAEDVYTNGRLIVENVSPSSCLDQEIVLTSIEGVSNNDGLSGSGSDDRAAGDNNAEVEGNASDQENAAADGGHEDMATMGAAAVAMSMTIADGDYNDDGYGYGNDYDEEWGNGDDDWYQDGYDPSSHDSRFHYCGWCERSIPWDDKLISKHDNGRCPVCKRHCQECKCFTCQNADCHGGVFYSYLGDSWRHNRGEEIDPATSCHCKRCSFCKLLLVRKKGEGWNGGHCECRVPFPGLKILESTAFDFQTTKGIPTPPGKYGTMMVITRPHIPSGIKKAKDKAKELKRDWKLRLQWWMEEPKHVEVATPKAVRKMLGALVATISSMPPGNTEPVLAFDMEAFELGRGGRDCYLQIRDLPAKLTYLIDLLTLGAAAFQQQGPGGVTLQNMFEDAAIRKLAWDIRKDSEALFHHYAIRLQGVVDVQVCAMLSQRRFPKHRFALAKHVNRLTTLTKCERNHWNRAKFYPFNGDYSVFLERPLRPALKDYAVTDVRFLQNAYKEVMPKLGETRLGYAMQWTREEVERSWIPAPDERADTRQEYRRYWNGEVPPNFPPPYPGPMFPPPPPTLKDKLKTWTLPARTAVTRTFCRPSLGGTQPLVGSEGW